MKLHFLGANQTVTGSRHLIETNGKKYLIDCGLFQGYKELRQRNWDPFPVNPSSIDGVLLTHAHIDHSGYLPRFVKQGFRGKIHATSATHALCDILLPDSARIHEEDARRANKYGYSKHHPALPLYTEEDAKKALKKFKNVQFYKTYELSGNVKVTYSHAGHILGAGFIRLDDGETSILFSGDLGRLHDPVIKAPDEPTSADYIVLESTYGARRHVDIDPRDELEEVIRSTVSKGGTVVIPAFAVGRAQAILYYVEELLRSKKIPNVKIFVDSPMATDVSDLLCEYMSELRISEQHCRTVCSFATYTRDVNASKRLNTMKEPKVIISASGMATGGRVLHHLKQYLGGAENTILFTGYQPGGTRGDLLVRGEEQVKIHGGWYPVKARIEDLDNMSAHADYEEILTWLEGIKKPPKKVFLTHGDLGAAESLKQKIEEKFGWTVEIPTYLQVEEL